MGVRFAATVAVAVVMASCGGGADRTADPVTTTSAPASVRDQPALPGPKGPGSAIADDLVVPPGAHLLGRAFPSFDYFVESGKDAWQAVAVVDGDGRRALDGLVAQAERAGYAVDHPADCSSGSVCTALLTRGEHTVEVRLVVGRCGALGASHLVLRSEPVYHPMPYDPATTASSLPTKPATRTVDPPATTTEPTRPEPSTSTSTTGTTSTTSIPATGLTSTSQPPPPARELPDPDPRLPGPGDLIDAANASGPTRVEPGSRLAGRPVGECDPVDPGIAVLVVDDDVDAVVDAYATQFAATSGEQARVSEVAIHDDAVTTVSAAGHGGWWDLTVVEHDGAPTFGLVQSGIDT